MSVYNAVTKVTIAKQNDLVILTHTLDRSKDKKPPSTLAVSLDVVAAGNLAVQLNEKVCEIRDRRFEKGGFPEKVLNPRSGRNHA